MSGPESTNTTARGPRPAAGLAVPARAAPADPGRGGVKRTVARNMLWNWAGTATNMLGGFVLAPYLIHHLGDLGYGLWILVGSLTGYFCVLDLGVRGSLARNLAFMLARQDQDRARVVLATGLALLGGAALLILAGTVGLVMAFPHLFDVPADQVGSARLALLLVGCHLALYFLASGLEAVLWANQRFDLINCVDIPAVVLRVGLTFLLIGAGGGLVALAIITVTVTALSAAAKLVLASRLEPGLHLRPRFLQRQAAVALLSFGVWCLVLGVTRTVAAATGPVLTTIIGSCLAVALLTPYSIAARLVDYVTGVLISSAGVLTPVATALHAQEQHATQQRLFLLGGRSCLTLALFFLGLYVGLGTTLIELWIGRPLPGAALVLLILTLGEVLPQSQLVTNNIVLGMDRHRPLACLGLLEVASVVVLGLSLVPAYGLSGVAATVALPGALCRGILPLVYACRLLRMPLRVYALRALLPAVAAAALPVGALLVLVRLAPPASWVQLVGYVAAYGMSYLFMAGLLLVGVEQIRDRAGSVLRVVVGPRRPEKASCPCPEANVP